MDKIQMVKIIMKEKYLLEAIKDLNKLANSNIFYQQTFVQIY